MIFRNWRVSGKGKLARGLRVVFLYSFLLPVPFTSQGAEIESINGGHISISVKKTELAEVFEMLSREGKVNILLGSDVDSEISVNLYDVTLDQAVRTISAAAGFAVEYVNNSYFIMTQDEAGKDMTGGMTSLKTFKAQYTDVDAIAEILNKHLSRYGKITTLPDRRLIVVEEIPAFMRRIEELLAELDRKPQQILIEAKILEITLDDSEIFGIDWSRLFKLEKDTKDEGIGSFGAQGLAAPGLPGFFFSFVSPNITAALNALSDKGRVRTLSTPKLLAREHEEAEVVIGDRTGYRVTTTINQVTTESVAFLESGVILKVIPFVDQNGQIMMDVHPEVSNATISNGIPSLTTTEVTTKFLADDGQTIFIAGLMRNSIVNRRTGVPILGDIPILGKLFSNSEKLVINTETVVLITPRIVEAGVQQFMSSESSRVNEIDNRLRKQVKEVEIKLDPELSSKMDEALTPEQSTLPQRQTSSATLTAAVLQTTPRLQEDLNDQLQYQEPVLHAQAGREITSCLIPTTDFMSLVGRC